MTLTTNTKPNSNSESKYWKYSLRLFQPSIGVSEMDNCPKRGESCEYVESHDDIVDDVYDSGITDMSDVKCGV